VFPRVAKLDIAISLVFVITVFNIGATVAVILVFIIIIIIVVVIIWMSLVTGLFFLVLLLNQR
jgi:hypothetical protein